jgi:hypothetical protein
MREAEFGESQGLKRVFSDTPSSVLPRSPGHRPGMFRAIGTLARVALIGAGLFSFSAAGKILHDDYAMGVGLVSMDQERCSSIANNYASDQRGHAIEACLARSSARESGYWRFAFAHAVAVFLALVAFPGIVTFVIAAMLRRSRNSN